MLVNFKEITREQFNKEVCALRESWGAKNFWTKPEVVRAAKHALCVCYFNTKVPPSEQKQLAFIFETTLREFAQRGEMLGIDIETGKKL